MDTIKILLGRIIAPLLLVLAGHLASAQQKEFINPDSLPPLSKSYTQAIRVTGGTTIYIAGQASVNEKKEIVGKGDFDAQVKQTLKNLRTVLAAAKASPTDLVKINTYVVGLAPEKLAVLRTYLKDFIGPNPPVSTLIGVQALFNPDAMIEIEAVAVVK